MKSNKTIIKEFYLECLDKGVECILILEKQNKSLIVMN